MKLMACLSIGAAFTLSAAAQATGKLADVAIVDRETGATLTAYYYRGDYWVAGRPGTRYAIEIHNHLGERVLAVTSVDGINVLSGADAAWDQAGYVFDGGSSYEISGWRKSDSEIATFVFTSPPGSYAERTGRMANVGVIGVALFRERLPVLSYAPPITYSAPTAGAPTAQAGAPATPAPVPAPPARSSSARAAAPGAALAEINSSRQLVQQLGTGHGQREYSHVDHTEFARLQPQPNEIIRIRYDSLDNLVAMGIVPQPYRAPPSLNPFPGSGQPQYVPDPPG